MMYKFSNFVLLQTDIEIMKREFTAIIEPSPEGGYWAVSPEIPGANGQGITIEEAKNSLRDSIKLLFEDKLEDYKGGLSEDVIMDTIAVE
mgnify:CR=1 FL=1